MQKGSENEFRKLCLANPLAEFVLFIIVKCQHIQDSSYHTYSNIGTLFSGFLYAVSRVILNVCNVKIFETFILHVCVKK